MLDTTTENLMTLGEASRFVRKHITTVYRWSTSGYRGVVLETIQVGGSRRTSREAIQRFCERLSGGATPRAVRTRDNAEKAGKELERYGF